MFADQRQDGRIDPAEIHDILRNDRRRKVLKYLKQRLEPVSLRALSEQIAEWEASESPAPRNLRQSVYNSLHQTHLPKLDAADIVDYDRNRKRIALNDRAREVDVYLDVVTWFGITWSTYYRTLGVVALSTVMLGAMGVPLIGQLEPLFSATVFLFVYALSTIYQLWSRRWFYLRALVNPE